jgi:hypothetical protein
MQAAALCAAPIAPAPSATTHRRDRPPRRWYSAALSAETIVTIADRDAPFTYFNPDCHNEQSQTDCRSTHERHHLRLLVQSTNNIVCTPYHFSSGITAGGTPCHSTGLKCSASAGSSSVVGRLPQERQIAPRPVISISIVMSSSRRPVHPTMAGP